MSQITGSHVVGGTAAAVIAAGSVMAFVAGWEGYRDVDYLDIVGVPTACYGSTKGAVVGKRRSQAECNSMLARDVVDHALELSRCITVDVPAQSYQAFVSWSYNVGTSGACRSTAIRKLNQGDLRGACEGLMAWNKVTIKGKLQVSRGLDNRRRAERALCLQGLTK